MIAQNPKKAKWDLSDPLKCFDQTMTGFLLSSEENKKNEPFLHCVDHNSGSKYDDNTFNPVNIDIIFLHKNC